MRDSKASLRRNSCRPGIREHRWRRRFASALFNAAYSEPTNHSELRATSEMRACCEMRALRALLRTNLEMAAGRQLVVRPQLVVSPQPATRSQLGVIRWLVVRNSYYSGCSRNICVLLTRYTRV